MGNNNEIGLKGRVKDKRGIGLQKGGYKLKVTTKTGKTVLWETDNITVLWNLIRDILSPAEYSPDSCPNLI